MVDLRLEQVFERKVKLALYLTSLIIAVAIIVYGYLTVSVSYSFHFYIAVALVAGLTAPAIIVNFEFRRKKLIDKAFPVLLGHLAQGQEAGMTLFQALEEASQRKYGPITRELKRLVAQLSFGIELDKAFLAFSKRIGTELAFRVNALLVESVRLGGDLKKIFNSTADFVKDVIRLREERESELRTYLFIVYICVGIFLILAVILYQNFFVPMAVNQTPLIVSLSISAIEYKSLMFDLAILEGFFGGLIAGKLTEGVTLNGLKHSVALIVISIIVFSLLL